MDSQYLYPLYIALVGLIIGFCFEGNDAKNRTPFEKLCTVIKWTSVVVIALYILVIVAAMTDGLGDLPLLGGGYVWVRGHWRRR